MHFSSAALFALCSISVTQAAPFANPENEDLARRAAYSVVNADGDSSSSSVAREVDTVFEVSTVTAPGAEPVAITVTVTATPSSAYSSTPVASSTPCLETPTPGSSSFFRRGLRAAGQPALFAREYSSSSSAYPTAAASESLYARGWYSAASATPSAAASPTASSTALVARGFGDWSSSASVSPSSSLSASAAATHLVARGWYSSSATPSASATRVVARGWYSSSATPSASVTRVVARDLHASPSGTPSSSRVTNSAAPLAARGPYGWFSSAASASSVATPSASSALVARGIRSWGPSSVSSPASGTFAPSATPVVY
ncbi:hypothetical protein N7517_000584 [Penicillium concentricum]|uniref:Uncharacterized protein n=1 Tax=Penicillium concentricum TaxID=293559 RepID=A0A9W9VHQ5_9EURO|nr:uncharacterized protein N7517_000584 [Penicillium concentricum]KAJ5382673.1 hypothetical protein N7517_000584 [Penicillium concentricum]